MRSQSKPSEQHGDVSIISVIEEEERRLALRVAQAKVDAERVVSEAQEDAAARVKAFLEQLPPLVEKRRHQEVARIEREMDLSRRQARHEMEELRARIAARIDRAAEFAARAVWPEARNG